MKKEAYIYMKSDETVNFEYLRDTECFYSGGVLYMKINSQDLKAYNINNVNAISLLNAGLTFFEKDEIVNKAARAWRIKK